MCDKERIIQGEASMVERVSELKELKHTLQGWGMTDWQAINTAIRLLYLPNQMEFVVFPKDSVKDTKLIVKL